MHFHNGKTSNDIFSDNLFQKFIAKTSFLSPPQISPKHSQVTRSYKVLKLEVYFSDKLHLNFFQLLPI